MDKCVLCLNKFSYCGDFDMKTKEIESICEKHKKCLKCRSDLTLEEMKESLYYDTAFCFKDWCCGNPYKWLRLCPICEEKTFCKQCGGLDGNGAYVCKCCYKAYQHYCGGKYKY